MRYCVRLLVSLTVLLLVTSTFAQRPSEPEWANLILEVTDAIPQDPESELLTRREELRAVRDAATTDRARRDADRNLVALEARIVRKTPIIVTGWAMKMNERGAEASSTRTMAALIVPGRFREKLGTLEQGSVLRADRRGLTYRFSTGGRRYWSASRVDRIDAPAWWPSLRHPPPPPTNVERLRAAVQASMRFEKRKDQSTSALHRYQIKLAVPDPPQPSLEVVLDVRLDLKGGETLGPFRQTVDLKRGSKGTMGMSRSWEIIVPRGAPIRVESARVEVVSAG